MFLYEGKKPDSYTEFPKVLTPPNFPKDTGIIRADDSSLMCMGGGGTLCMFIQRW